MNQTSNFQSDSNTANERLAKAFYSSGRYNPVLLTVTGIGFIVIFLLTRFGVLGNPAPQVLYIGLLTLCFAVAQIALLTLAERGQGIAAHLYGSATAGIFAILLTLFWQGIVPIAILIALAIPVMAWRSGLPRRYFSGLLLQLIVMMSLIAFVNASSPAERLVMSTPASIVSIVFLIATGLLLLTITIVSRNRNFRSLQALLLTSFVIIVMVPTVLTAILSAVGAYTNSQTQTFNTLEAITILKVNQVETLLASSQSDAKALLADSRFTSNALGILSGNNDPSLDQNFKRIARTRAAEVLGAEEEAYDEIMVLDTHGNVVISTLASREGTNFQKQTFFQLGLLRFYAGFAEEKSFGTKNLVSAIPIFDFNRRDIRGVLVLRSDASGMKAIMENTPGFSAAETYFVDAHFAPVTDTRAPTKIVDSKAALETIRNKVTTGKDIYSNYADQRVLGYYQWFAPMQVAVIAEVPLSFVISSSLDSLISSGVLALFLVIVAIIAVVISARTITDPITALAETTQSFAAGKFSTRAIVERKDEIGALAQAYNQMAAQLQEMIAKLEQRVASRTQDLESQTLRLRVAAEIARDSTSARDLNDLLTQAAALICDRFGFDHTGIFLLDKNHEYAVLVASPTEEGKKMIENNHRLRVGEIGIVGRVAATGEPRVTLNTGTDAVYFNNPYLPNTNSEMALPLKVENTVIGVLDVQSNQTQAFSDDDIAIMQILADQLATAIERARLLEEVEVNLKELESAYGHFTKENWRKMSAGSLTGIKGYRFDNVRIEPINTLPELADAALRSGTIVNANDGNHEADKDHKVAVPIKLRGQTIGVVNLTLREGYDNSILSVIELATERLAAAMESARLYEEARLRADREQSISRVTTAISASTEYEQILQTTIKEIGSILGDTEVAIQILDEPTTGRRVESRE